ncbi:MAG: amidohydrolase [Candidatus Bathyarchaeota archaeon]|nr:amidohydrolase [Candidatus Bathyarchaeota archaeon]
MSCLEFKIVGGSIVTMSEIGIVRDGCIIVEDGEIIDVGSRDIASRYPGYDKIDASGCVAIPGLINCHHHIAMGLLRGYADDLALSEWLEKWVWPFESKLTGYDIYVGALLTAVESILSGCTTVNTMYHYAPDYSEAKAIMDSGMRGVVGHVCFSWRREDDLKLTDHLYREWHGKDGRIRVSIDPHACYTVDPSYMVELHNLCLELNDKNHESPVTFHTHLAETEDEPVKVKKAFGVETGKSVVSYMENLGVLDEYTVAAHCVYVSEDDISILAKRRVKVVHCPVSNLKLSSGIAPIPAMLKRGVKVTIGTDSVCSHNRSDMFETMKFTALIHKGVCRDPTVMPAFSVLKAATISAAEALMWDKLGAIKPGYYADIAILDFRKPHLMPLYDEYSHIIYAARGSDVRYVLIDGKLVVDEGRITTVDVEWLLEEAVKARDSVLDRIHS